MSCKLCQWSTMAKAQVPNPPGVIMNVPQLKDVRACQYNPQRVVVEDDQTCHHDTTEVQHGEN